MSMSLMLITGLVALALAFGGSYRIGVSLGHPQPSAIVIGKGNRLMDLGLTGSKLNAKSGGNGHLLGCLLRRQAVCGLAMRYGLSVVPSFGVQHRAH